jgi:GTP-binding protein EngB required for normal cell division
MEVQSKTPDPSPPGADPLARLQALSYLASDAGALTVASEASLLTARTEQGLFYVACLGQFKRGKSTLLNALVGETALPTGVVPVTSVVTVIRHGTHREARVRLAVGQWRNIDPWDLSAYVSEEENPNNVKGVLAAEVFLPHPLLASGLCLVDTPGLGSTYEGSTAATRSFIPHIDAALVVLGADPPISGDELALVEDVVGSVHHLLFVLNKADRLSDRERQEARRFTERVLAQRLGRPIGPILEVSAAESLSAGCATRELPALYEALQALARDAGADLVARAQFRGIERLADRVLTSLAEQRDALIRPAEDSQRRIEILRRSVEDAERAAGDLAHLFSSEQQRLSQAFTKKRDEFLSEVLPAARKELESAAAASGERGVALRRLAPSLARDVASRTIETWLREVEPVAEDLYRSAMRRFVELANEFFERLAASDESFAALPSRTLDPEAGFRASRRFYFNDLFELAPSSIRLLAAAGNVTDYLVTLLEHNSTRIVNDLDERVLESRRHLEFEISNRLREGRDAAVAALARARARQSAGRQAVDQELARIESLERKVRALAQISRPPSGFGKQ